MSSIKVKGLNILDPNVNPFLAPEYTGGGLNYSALNIAEYVSAEVTVQSNTTKFGQFVINEVINRFNLQHGASLDPNEYGIVPIHNDQNSRCAYMLFPLVTNNKVVIRVYLELGTDSIFDFNRIGAVPAPNYL